MRPWRREGGSAIEPNLTPLLDVVLQLIVFFLMLVHFGREIEGAALTEARVPVAPAGRATVEEDGPTLVVGIDAAGRLVAGEPAVAIDDAGAWWAEEGERRGEAAAGTLVLVRADRGATFGAVRRVLAAAQEHGFGRFSLVVERERR